MNCSIPYLFKEYGIGHLVKKTGLYHMMPFCPSRTNSANPDEMPHNLGIQCLPKYLVIVTMKMVNKHSSK